MSKAVGPVGLVDCVEGTGAAAMAYAVDGRVVFGPGCMFLDAFVILVEAEAGYIS